MRTLTHRQILIELLRTHHDALTAWDSRSAGGGVLLMPSLYHEGSYAELERRLAEMRDCGQRKPWWHLSHRYRWGVVRQDIIPCRRTRRGPIPRLRPYTELVSAGPVHGQRMSCLVYEWRPDVQPHQVELALDHLLATMHGGDTRRIMLPPEVFQRALGLPLEERRGRRESPTLPTRRRAVTLTA